MKGARLTNSSTPIPGDILLNFPPPRFLNTRFFPTDKFARQVGVWWTVGRHCHDDWIPDAHVLSVDMSMVL
jgi:hypothetical protein